MWAPYMVSPERGLGLFGLMIVSVYLEQDLQFWLHLDVLYVFSIVSFSRVLNFFIVRVGSFRLSGSLFHCLGRSCPVLLVSFFTTMLLGNRCGLFDGSFLKICLSLGGVRFFSVFFIVRHVVTCSRSVALRMFIALKVSAVCALYFRFAMFLTIFFCRVIICVLA